LTENFVFLFWFHCNWEQSVDSKSFDSFIKSLFPYYFEPTHRLCRKLPNQVQNEPPKTRFITRGYPYLAVVRRKSSLPCHPRLNPCRIDHRTAIAWYIGIEKLPHRLLPVVEVGTRPCATLGRYKIEYSRGINAGTLPLVDADDLEHGPRARGLCMCR
jgi:hypothetical protein